MMLDKTSSVLFAKHIARKANELTVGTGLKRDILRDKVDYTITETALESDDFWEAIRKTERAFRSAIETSHTGAGAVDGYNGVAAPFMSEYPIPFKSTVYQSSRVKYISNGLLEPEKTPPLYEEKGLSVRKKDINLRAFGGTSIVSTPLLVHLRTTFVDRKSGDRILYFNTPSPVSTYFVSELYNFNVLNALYVFYSEVFGKFAAYKLLERRRLILFGNYLNAVKTYDPRIELMLQASISVDTLPYLRNKSYKFNGRKRFSGMVFNDFIELEFSPDMHPTIGKFLEPVIKSGDKLFVPFGRHAFLGSAGSSVSGDAQTDKNISMWLLRKPFEFWSDSTQSDGATIQIFLQEKKVEPSELDSERRRIEKSNIFSLSFSTSVLFELVSTAILMHEFRGRRAGKSVEQFIKYFEESTGYKPTGILFLRHQFKVGNIRIWQRVPVFVIGGLEIL